MLPPTYKFNQTYAGNISMPELSIYVSKFILPAAIILQPIHKFLYSLLSFSLRERAVMRLLRKLRQVAIDLFANFFHVVDSSKQKVILSLILITLQVINKTTIGTEGRGA
jgi:hypothetical protein